MSFPASSAAARGLATCHLCLKTASVSLHECPRCGSGLHFREPESLQRTVALLVTATLLYIPANVLPIMTTYQFGSGTESTILGGVILLIELDSIPIAAVIFIASVMVPSGKLLMMFWLVWGVHRRHQSSGRQRAIYYRVTEFVGRWSMVDVFVVTILVALIHLVGLMVITPGPAALAFGGVVVVTMLAAESFDPRLMWDQLEEPQEKA